MAGRIEPVDFVEALEAALATVTDEETSIRARLDELQMERRGLELALRRYRIPVQQPAPVMSGSYAQHTGIGSVDDLTTTAEEQTAERAGELAEAEAAEEAERLDPADFRQPEATMTDLVTEILRSAERPIGPKDVVAILNTMGMPQESTTQVRGTIGYLNRKGQLRQISRGAWVLKGGPLDRTDNYIPVTPTGTLTDAETPTAESAAEVSEREEPVEGGHYQPASLVG